jgi:hypothetical protein
MARSKKTPEVGSTLERVFAPWFKFKVGTNDKILDSARHQHLAACGFGRNPGCYVNAQTVDILSSDSDLACMHTTPDLHAHRGSIRNN